MVVVVVEVRWGDDEILPSHASLLPSILGRAPMYGRTTIIFRRDVMLCESLQAPGTTDLNM